MESFEYRELETEIPPVPVQTKTRRSEGIRWDKIGKEVRLKGEARRGVKTAELIYSRLKEAFPGVIIKAHRQPRKK